MDCVKPVISLPKHFKKQPHTLKDRIRFQWLKWKDSPPVLPESFSLIPKRLDCYSEVNFGQVGSPDLSTHKFWEEHFWGGAPFGFHVQKHIRIKKTTSDLEGIKEILEQF